MFTCAEIRRRARRALGNQIFSTEWLFALLVSLVVSGILGLASSFVILPLLIGGPLTFGLNQYYLNLSRRAGKADSVEPIIDGFRIDLSGNIITGLLISLYTFLWSLLFFIPGIVKNLSYSMAFYIKADHPELSASQAITASRRFMDGYKMKLFFLYLSFIGWIFVGAFCCGIGTLWVDAYMKAATTEFYLQVKAEREGYVYP